MDERPTNVFRTRVNPDIGFHEAELEYQRLDAFPEDELGKILEDAGVDFERFNQRFDNMLSGFLQEDLKDDVEPGL